MSYLRNIWFLLLSTASLQNPALAYLENGTPVVRRFEAPSHPEDASAAGRLDPSLIRHDLIRRQNVSTSASSSSSGAAVLPGMPGTTSTSPSISPTVSATSLESSSSASVVTSTSPSITPVTTSDTTSIPNEGGGVTSQTTTSGPDVIVPVQSTITSNDQTIVQTSLMTQQATASTVVPVVTTNPEGQSVTTSQTVAAVPVRTTDSRGRTITSLQPLTEGGSGTGSGGDVTTTDQFGNTVILPSPTSGQVVVVTDQAGVVVTTTFNPDGGPVKTTVVVASTLSNGGQTLITQTAYVVPNAAASDQGQSQTTAQPSLRNGAAIAGHGDVLGAFAFAIGVVGVALAS